MPIRDLTFRELFTPRVVYSYTLEEAFAATPRILLMIAMFLAILIGAFLVKKLLEFIFFRRYMREKFMLKEHYTVTEGGKPELAKRWTHVPTQHWASIGHLILETLFVSMIMFAAIFACAMGGIEFWTTAVGVGLFGVVLAYTFGAGLQQAGAAYFCYLMNSVAYDEWWELEGSKAAGRVVRITPFFVELESEDPETHSACLYRVPMLTILNGILRRDYYKEANAPQVSFYKNDVTGEGFVGPAKIIRPLKKDFKYK